MTNVIVTATPTPHPPPAEVLGARDMSCMQVHPLAQKHRVAEVHARANLNAGAPLEVQPELVPRLRGGFQRSARRSIA